jgi:hypothetical protein
MTPDVGLVADALFVVVAAIVTTPGNIGNLQLRLPATF